VLRVLVGDNYPKVAGHLPRFATNSTVLRFASTDDHLTPGGVLVARAIRLRA
jgi:hypothetical protein